MTSVHEYYTIANGSANNASCANHGSDANRNAWQDCRICANHGPLLDNNGFCPEVGSITRLRMPIIAECRIRSNEDVVLNPHPIPNLDTAFNCHVITNNHIILDETIGTDIAIFAYFRLRQDDAKLPDPSPLANVLRPHI